LRGFSETNTLVNGLSSTLTYLKNLNSKLQNNKFDYETEQAYYLPQGNFSSKVSTNKDQLVIAKSGEPYIGAYFERSNSTLWTKANPSECPCYKLLPQSEYLKLKQSYIKEDWQTLTFLLEGWYSLLNNEYINARKRFGQIIFFLIHEHARDYDTLYQFIDSSIEDLDSVEVDGYQGLRDILDKYAANYEGKENFKFMNQLCKSKIALNSYDLCNNTLNFGHTYLIEGEFEEALKIYKYLDLNYTLKEFELTIFQIIQNDLSEFESKGLIKKKDTEFILNNLK